jgi:hypothetical protein
MDKHPRAIAYDDDIWWPESPMSGSAHYVSSDKPAPAPSLLVPDGHGGYREHQVIPKPRGRLGF